MRRKIVVLPDQLIALAEEYGYSLDRMGLRAQDLVKEKKYSAAYPFLVIITACLPDNGEGWVKRGIVQYHAEYDEILRLQQMDGLSEARVAKAIQGMSDALQHLKKATSILGRSHHLSWYYLAGTYLMLGQLQRKLPHVRLAREAYAIALKSSPGDSKTRKAIAEIDALLASPPNSFTE